MAYSEDALKAKLSTLNETQDSIVSVSQWITFYRRHADRIANFWLTRLRDSPPTKRLNYIYLVNDIVQNARVRKRSEFPDAFSPLMPEACQTAYRSSTPEIQGKIRRVVEVWKQRNVFEAPIISAIEARLDEVEQAKGSSGKKTLMGKSLFNSSGSGMPKELESLGPLQAGVTKATLDGRPDLDAAEREYLALNDPDGTLPALPVHAARFSSLIKSLAAAETSLTASIKARQALVVDLERILESNKKALAKDEGLVAQLGQRKTDTETKKREVEDSIMRGLDPAEASPQAVDMDIGNGDGRSSSFVDERPEVEELTPEPEEVLLSPPSAATYEPVAFLEFASPSQTLSGLGGGGGSVGASSPSRVRVASSGSLNGSSAKRRKLSQDEVDVMPDLGDMGLEHLGQGPSGDSVLVDLDADVNELLRQEGGGGM